MSGNPGDDPVFDESCYRCDAVKDLVRDPRVPDLHICRDCLERVARQNEMIERGLEEEPGVES